MLFNVYYQIARQFSLENASRISWDTQTLLDLLSRFRSTVKREKSLYRIYFDDFSLFETILCKSSLRVVGSTWNIMIDFLPRSHSIYFPEESHTRIPIAKFDSLTSRNRPLYRFFSLDNYTCKRNRFFSLFHFWSRREIKESLGMVVFGQINLKSQSNLKTISK